MYEASDIKVGQVLLCIDNGDYPFWTKGKRYEVVADEQGKPCLYSDSGEQPLSHRTANDISVYLNSQPNNGEVVMQIVEDGKEEPTMTKQNKDFTGLKAGDMLTRNGNGERTSWWTEGASYEVFGDENAFWIKDEEGDKRWFTVKKDGTLSNYDVQRGFYWDKTKKVYTEEITLTITGADYYKLQENLEAALDLVEQINYHTRSREEQIKQLDQFKGDK